MGPGHPLFAGTQSSARSIAESSCQALRLAVFLFFLIKKSAYVCNGSSHALGRSKFDVREVPLGEGVGFTRVGLGFRVRIYSRFRVSQGNLGQQAPNLENKKLKD